MFNVHVFHNPITNLPTSRQRITSPDHVAYSVNRSCLKELVESKQFVHNYCYFLQTVIYDKSLRLSTYALTGGSMTVGHVTNHMSTDAMNLLFYFQKMHFIWAIPFQVGKVLGNPKLESSETFKRFFVHILCLMSKRWY